MEKFPDYAENIIDDAGSKTIFDVLTTATDIKMLPSW